MSSKISKVSGDQPLPAPVAPCATSRKRNDEDKMVRALGERCGGRTWECWRPCERETKPTSRNHSGRGREARSPGQVTLRAPVRQVVDVVDNVDPKTDLVIRARVHVDNNIVVPWKDVQLLYKPG